MISLSIILVISRWAQVLMFSYAIACGKLGACPFAILAINSFASITVTILLFHIVYRQNLNRQDWVSVLLLGLSVLMIGNGDHVHAIDPLAGQKKTELMWVAVAMAVCASICYSFTAIQSKFVSSQYPRLNLSHLNVDAQFCFGVFLLPFFLYEISKAKPVFTQNDVLITMFGTIMNLLGSVAIA